LSGFYFRIVSAAGTPEIALGVPTVCRNENEREYYALPYSLTVSSRTYELNTLEVKNNLETSARINI
jgi:hypothetical protein